MINKISKNKTRMTKQKRVRAKVKGTELRPRLCVFRSLNNISVQVIDDKNAVTLAQASTLDKEIKIKTSNIAAATEVGALIAKRLLDIKISNVVFDRNGYLYHGKVKAVAEAARKAGLEF
ncbi:MAG: 50S ribosomal protein L18 [Terrisporobacter sp.]